jgi:hypothetical protein
MRKSLFACLLGLIVAPGASIAKPGSWSVRFKAELVGRVILADHVEVDSFRQIIFYCPIGGRYYEHELEYMKQCADDCARLIFDYVLADSLKSFRSVLIYFTRPEDTLSAYYRCDRQTILDLGIKRTSSQDRNNIVEVALPYESASYYFHADKKQRWRMGFQLDLDRKEQLPASEARERYAKNVAELLYDYVLHRHSRQITNIGVQYKYRPDEDKPAMYFDNIYTIDSSIFKKVDEGNAVLY